MIVLRRDRKDSENRVLQKSIENLHQRALFLWIIPSPFTLFMRFTQNSSRMYNS